MTTLTFGQIAIDAARADELAGFWSRLLDRPIAPGANEHVAVIPGDDQFPGLMFLDVPEAPTAKNRLHLDLTTTDIRAEVERAVSLGATKLGDYAEFGFTWTSLTDPEGNVFDIALAPTD